MQEARDTCQRPTGGSNRRNLPKIALPRSKMISLQPEMLNSDVQTDVTDFRKARKTANKDT